MLDPVGRAMLRLRPFITILRFGTVQETASQGGWESDRLAVRGKDAHIVFVMDGGDEISLVLDLACLKAIREENWAEPPQFPRNMESGIRRREPKRPGRRGDNRTHVTYFYAVRSE